MPCEQLQISGSGPLTTAFTSELIWAANRVDQLTSCEKRRLLEHAVKTIGELLDKAGIPSSSIVTDALKRLRLAAATAGSRAPERETADLLEAAEIITKMRIVADSVRAQLSAA